MRATSAAAADAARREDDWAAHKENEPVGNRRREPRESLEDAPVAGSKASFEELLARELEKTGENSPAAEAWSAMPGKTAGRKEKKPFLRKGARGWWMQQPDAKDRMLRHTLMSKDEEDAEAAGNRSRPEKRTTPSSGRKPKPQKAAPALDILHRPSAAPPSPPSPVQQCGYSRHEVAENTDSPALSVDWKDASFVSNATMGMSRVRLSFEAKREREADELAEFEAIERELAAERNGYLQEKEESQEQKQNGSAHAWRGTSPDEPTRWHTRQYSPPTLPQSAAQSMGSLHGDARAAASATSPAVDDRLDLDARSDFIFDGKQSAAFLHDQDEWRRYSTEDSMDLDHRLSDPLFGRGHHPPSELSAISFDDSVPWDDGLTLQPQEAHGPSPLEHLRSPRARGSSGSASSLLGDAHAHTPTHGDAPNGYGSFDSPGLQAQRTSRSQGLAGGYGFDTVHEDPELSEEFNDEDDDQVPVSSLVQQVFGDAQSDEDSFSIASHYEEMFDHDQAADQSRTHKATSGGARQDSDKVELATLKRGLPGKQRVANAAASQRGGGGSSAGAYKGTRPRPGVPQRGAANKPRTGANGSRIPSRSSPLGSSGPILPTVIEEKLYELEEEVRFYKAETLQLQRKKEHYDQEARKLLREREEFARYQQEQRTLMEKEWQQERAKMKKEQQLMDRQWKLRMSATSSTQDRRAKGEIEVLKAQIVKMQVDEATRTTKWKSSNENLRQRIVELEVKNQELGQEIKFLENDRLTQWEKFERQLKEKQHKIDRLASSSGVGDPEARRNPFERDDPIRTTDDLFSIRNAADELLTSWSRDAPPYERAPSAGCTDEAQMKPPSQDPSNSGAVASFSTTTHRRAHSSTDGYNPKRYSLEKAASEPSASMTNLSSETRANAERKQFVASTRSDGTRNNLEEPTRQHAVGDLGFADQAQHEVHVNTNARDQGLPPRAVTSSASQSTTKQVARQVLHAGGKKEIVFTDGSKRILFADGNEKEIQADGRTLITFTNGDRKEVFPDTGISIYHYHEAKTKLTTYPDQTKVYEFPNQQIEKSFPDGSTEIVFADGITKTIRANGDEFSVFPDGTTMLERKDGLREVALLNGKKIRYYTDGRMACVGSDGEEIEVRSDAELRRLMER